MAISVSFRGTTIWRPGAYSNLNISLEGAPALGATGLVAIIGEASAGPHYSEEVDIARNFATGDTFRRAINKYRTGALVDALPFLFAPANDGSIPNGASSVFILKTNKSTRATRVLEPAAPNSYGTVRAEEYGVGGNKVSFKSTLKSTDPLVAAGEAGKVSIACAMPGAIEFDAAPETFSIIHNGVSKDIVLDEDYADNAALLVAINLQLDTLPLTASISGGNLIIKMDNSPFADGYKHWIKAIPSASFEFPVAIQWASNEPACELVFEQTRDLIKETETVGGSVAIQIWCDKAGVASAHVNVLPKKIELYEDGDLAATIVKKEVANLSKLAEAINLQDGWHASVGINDKFLPVSSLDHVAGVEAFVAMAQIKKDAYSVVQVFEQSSMVDLINTQASPKGLPEDHAAALLKNGELGITENADIVGALAKLEKFHINFIIPLFSRDASADAADELTDENSSYEIDAIHQNVRNHIGMMKSIKKRSERQGYLSYKASYEDSVIKALELGDARIQLLIQDILQTDAQGNIKWFQPWALACLVAGARCGGSIGLPLTNKFLNASGIRHTSQPMTTEDADIKIEFDPDLDFEDAIQKGITFCEAPFTGGFKIMLDNTTYGQNDNWVWNRGSVIYAADIAAKNIRDFMEARYVGVKNSLTVAEVTSSLESLLNSLLAQGVTVSSGRAPNGYRNLVVRIEGSKIEVEVNITLPEGIEFILAEITVERNLG